MKRWAKVVLAMAVAVLAAGPARAQIPIPNPVELALLADIVRALREAHEFLGRINRTAEEARRLMREMFPTEALQQIRTLFRSVRSIQKEIEQLACSWRFSPRVEGLRLGLLRKGPLCRDQYQGVFGAPLPGPDRDLEELQQWAANRRLNVVASTIEASEQWTTTAERLGAETRQGGGPGGPASYLRSVRQLAAITALGLQQAVRQNTHEAELLSAAQEELDAERRELWHERNGAWHALQWFRGAGPVVGESSVAREMGEGGQ